MVFGDYELISTKRTNHERRNMNVFRRRYFNALGGWNTVYTTTLFAAAGYSFGNVAATELVPAVSSVTTKSGFLRYFSRAGVWVIVPAFLGYATGVGVFGDINEVRRLGVLSR